MIELPVTFKMLSDLQSGTIDVVRADACRTYGDQRAAEARADALQALERVPMTYSQIFMINPKGYTVNEAFAFRRGIRAAEAHHGITSQESKG